MKLLKIAVFMLALGVHNALFASESPCRQLSQAVQERRVDVAQVQRLLRANPTLDPRCTDASVTVSPMARLLRVQDWIERAPRQGVTADVQSFRDGRRLFEERIKSLDSRK